MKIIKRNSDNVVLYAGENITLDATQASNGDWVDARTTLANATLINDVTLPADYLGGTYTFDGATWTQTAAAAAAAAADIEAKRIASIPVAVTMRQARLALMGAGMLASVNSMIAGMAGAQGDAARIEWEFSSEVKRNQPLVLALGPTLGMTSLQLDALFVAAGKL